MNGIEGFVIPLTYLAVIASAVSGASEARRHNLDVVGATTVAFVTAFGGGTLRDLLLGRIPIFWIADPGLTVTTFFTAILSFYLVSRVSNSLLFLPDALGLGFFSMLGTTYALHMDLSLLVASLMGVVTGVFGGILRDVLCNTIPNIFRRETELYATCSFLGVWVFILLVRSGMEASAASWIGTLTVVGLRILAVRFHLRLPIP